MFRGTTPKLKLKVNSTLNLMDCKEIWVSFAKNGMNKVVTYDLKKLEVTDNNIIELELTQEETLAFGEGDVEVQIRVLTQDDKAYASVIKKMPVSRILTSGVIS